MYQIGILSKAGSSLTKVRGHINKSNFFEPKVFNNSNDFVLALKNNFFKAFVLNNEEFKESHVHIIHQIKKYFPELPVLIVVEKLNPELKKILSQFQKCILVNINVELDDINGILMKLINNIPVKPRYSNRYKTAQPAKLKTGADTNHSAWILNLAQDGACFRVFNYKFKKGDILKIEVPLPQLKKTHIIQGQIVWQKPDKLNSEYSSFSQRIGVKFLAA